MQPHTWPLHRLKTDAIFSHSEISWPLSCLGYTETSIRTGPWVWVGCFGTWFSSLFWGAVAKPSLAARLKEAASLYTGDKKPGRGEGDGKEEDVGGGSVT